MRNYIQRLFDASGVSLDLEGIDFAVSVQNPQELETEITPILAPPSQPDFAIQNSGKVADPIDNKKFENTESAHQEAFSQKPLVNSKSTSHKSSETQIHEVGEASKDKAVQPATQDHVQSNPISIQQSANDAEQLSNNDLLDQRSDDEPPMSVPSMLVINQDNIDDIHHVPESDGQTDIEPNIRNRGQAHEENSNEKRNLAREDLIPPLPRLSPLEFEAERKTVRYEEPKFKEYLNGHQKIETKGDEKQIGQNNNPPAEVVREVIREITRVEAPAKPAPRSAAEASQIGPIHFGSPNVLGVKGSG